MTDEHQIALLQHIDAKVSELVKWKSDVNDLLYGSVKGEFGYFHKSNILWRIIVLWPVMIMSVAFGAGLTIAIQHLFR